MIPASTNQLLTANTGYRISRSLRFRSSASAYLSRTFGTPTSATTGTMSFWIKRGTLGSGTQTIHNDSGNNLYFGFANNGTAADTFGVFLNNSTAAKQVRVTTQIFRDPSAWYHIVIAIDTTNATAANRILLYVNGVSVSSFATTNTVTQNSNVFVGSIAHYIGTYGSSLEFMDGYLAEFNYIDGQALTPSSFGAFDTNGVWQPARYTGSYGTNGFYLNFSDNSGATATTIGKDSSGNSNNWTPTNIVVTSGTTCDSMIDSPTNYADGGTGRGNYAVLNPLQSGAYVSQTNGNLTNTGNTATNSALVLATIGNLTSGKWYWEYTQGTVQSETCGIVTTYTPGTSLLNGEGIGSYGIGARATGAVYGGTVGTITSWTNGDIIGLAVDCDNGAIYWSKNGTWLNSGVPTSGSSKTGAVGVWTPSSSINVTPAFGAYNGGFVSVTFGQRPFTYTPPSGFSALNTQNLPSPTIAAGNKYFDATTYGGDSASPRSFTNSGTFQPDLVWIKNRTTAGFWNVLFDSVRGVGNQLASNQTDAELASASNVAGKVSAFNVDGFSVLAGSSGIASVNATSNNYVAWQWKGGGTAVSNTSGSITSTVSANPSAGFSVVTYTGNSTDNTNYTVGHGLGVTPSLIIIKNRDWAASTGAWVVWHNSQSNSIGYLNTTDPFSSSDFTYFMNAAPTSSLFSVRSDTTVSVPNRYRTNGGGTYKYVAYCFAPIASYSSFGSYTGNGSTDGPFVYTGFRPRFVLVKNTSVAGDWYIFDTTRSSSSGLNVEDYKLYPNTSNAENGLAGETTSTNNMDTLSNGFKLRTTNGNTNGSTNVFIYAAFAENPFKTSRAR